ncbi:uncharacterized protein LOC126749803 [Anthonomus grandis grandis]|uniref:uncharacterized protein LOC126749803 n=1 Tax=Anthonomus grandis grandis TaxID=2921223 RepID=UPI002165CB8E|nr:uncharacterized protein LOC126749803 [Anthonomus grandis grandis]
MTCSMLVPLMEKNMDNLITLQSSFATHTFRYLATGDSMTSISFSFRIAHSTISQIIRETCDAIWECLHEKVLPKPDEDTWRNIAEGFSEKWQLPHCVGAIDGKHVIIQAPPKSGSTYYNYKGSHSIVLMALCDANYKFIMVDIGAEGRHSDGGIFKNSNMGRLIATNNLNFPPPCALIDNGDEVNFYICGDEAFPLSTCLMRPYPGRFLPQIKRIFNYRLSRGRRVVENAFGILSAKWRVYRKPIIAQEETVRSIVKATVCLHNFLIGAEKKYVSPTLVDREDIEGQQIDGEWRNYATSNLPNIKRTSTNMYGRTADIMRNKLATFFCNEGAVPFQWAK